jgi:hypothetical protein
VVQKPEDPAAVSWAWVPLARLKIWRLGVLGAGLAAAMVILGIFAGTDALARGFVPPGSRLDPKTFYAIPFFEMVTFCVLITLALRATQNTAKAAASRDFQFRSGHTRPHSIGIAREAPNLGTLWAHQNLPSADLSGNQTAKLLN